MDRSLLDSIKEAIEITLLWFKLQEILILLVSPLNSLLQLSKISSGLISKPICNPLIGSNKLASGDILLLDKVIELISQ